MDITLFSYKLLSVVLDEHDIELDDQMVSRLATLYRNELPKRHDLNNNYIASDTKNKRFLAIDNDSIMIRNNGVNDYEEVSKFSSNVLNELSKEFEIEESHLTITIAALYQFKVDDVHPISIEKFFPSSINEQYIPGEISSVGLRIVSQDADNDYDFRIEPSYEFENCFIVSLRVSTLEELQLNEIDLYTNLVNSKQLLDVTIKKIVQNW